MATTDIQLREHQQTAVVMLRQAIKGGAKRVILMACCSFGKTRCAAFLAASGASKGRRTMFVCDRIELIDQASATFDALGIDHGIIQANHPRSRPHLFVQIASIQTLQAKRTRLAKIAADLADGKHVTQQRHDAAVMPKADTIIIDEVHTVHQMHIELMRDNPDAIFIGLTATPWTKGLGRYYERTLQPITVQELIDKGYLIEPVVYGPPKDIDLSKVRIIAGDYNEDDLESVVNNTKLVGSIVEHWLELCKDEPTICFAVSVTHSKSIVEEFVKVGIAAEHIDGYETDKDIRRDKIERFRRGEIKVLSSVDILCKGFDYPGARCAIMARPTKSLMLFIQQIGRIMRIDPESGKDKAWILDHAGNHEQLGFVTDEFETELDMGKKAVAGDVKKKEKKEALPKKCPKCYFVKPAKVHKCPACGFEPRPPANVDIVDVGLQVISRGDKKRPDQLPLEKRFGSKKKVWAMLNGAKGQRADGWRAHKYRAIFGVWPRNMPDISEPPTPELLNWLRSEARKYRSQIDE